MIVWIISTAIILAAVIFFAISLLIIMRQKRLSEIQRDFINNMTHEFKTPISTIGISSDVLLKEGNFIDNERLKYYAFIIREENQRLARQVEKVLQAAILEKKEFRLNKEEIDLNILIQDVVKLIEPRLSEKNGKITYQLNTTRQIIIADKFHFRNVLFNLLDNAVKYSSTDLQIIVQLRMNDGYLEIVVQDNGHGIADEYQKIVFRKFYRVPSGNLHNVKGFGLGLAYVQTIINKHHWKIKLKSNEGSGSTFTIQIPEKYTINKKTSG